MNMGVLLKSRTKWLLGIAVAVSIVAVGGIFGVQSVKAAGANADWVNRGTIFYNGHNYVDSNPSDMNAEFTTTLPEYGVCPVKLVFTIVKNVAYNSNGSRLPGTTTQPDNIANNIFYYLDNQTPATAKHIYPSGKKDVGGNIVCTDYPNPIPTVGIDKIENRKVTFIQSDADTIINYKNLIPFKKQAVDRIYRRLDEGDQCKDLIFLKQPIADSSVGRGANIWANNQPVGGAGTAQPALLYGVNNGTSAGRWAESYVDVWGNANDLGGRKNCAIDNADLYSQGVFAAVSDASGSDSDKAKDFVAHGTDSGGADITSDNRNDDAFIIFVGNTDNLPKDANGNPILPNAPGLTVNRPACKGGGLGWVICPIVIAIQAISDAIRDAMASMLKVNPLPLDSTSTVYQIWENMRNFSNIAFVIAFMISIFSQATSIGLSSYGIKSLLPRLIAVAVLSNVSYYLCSFMIDAFNILGVGIENLFALANGGSEGTIQISNATGGLALGAVGAVIGATIFTGAIVQLFPLILVAFFAALTTFIVLIARQALVILLVVASPLIVVAGILPGTRRFFTGALNLFTTLLVMYPLIIGLFAAARIAGSILSQLGGGQ